ncbi:MAG: NAD(P)-dependent oxidoreductase [Desulfonatronovibrio sp.]
MKKSIPMEKISKNHTRIGWVGTGVMGTSMCSHILDAGFQVFVFNRTRNKAESLLHNGAKWVDSPREAAEKSDIVFTIVGFPLDVRNVYFEENGIISGLSDNQICVDMTTTSPTLAMEINKQAEGKNAFALDAPVSGGDVGARNGCLSIMAGGDEKAFVSVLPLLELMGENIIHQGPPGAGQHTKMCNQIVIAGTMIGVCESLVYAETAGLDKSRMLESISKGAAGCWSLNNLAPRILNDDFAPGFMIDHFIKDMGIALDECKRMNIRLPGLELVKTIYDKASASGHGSSGTQALYQALREISK